MLEFEKLLQQFMDGSLSPEEAIGLAQQIAASTELQQRVAQVADRSVLERLRAIQLPMLDQSLATIRIACAEESIERTTPEPSNRTIGNYKLLQCIGEGGMGSVWMADQTAPVKRKVALKLILCLAEGQAKRNYDEDG